VQRSAKGAWRAQLCLVEAQAAVGAQGLSKRRRDALIGLMASLSSGMSHHVLLVLGQVVGDGEPGRLGADKYVLGRTDSRVVNESSHGDMDKDALADDGKEERPADPAMRVVAVFVAEDQELVFARGDGELVALYSSEWLEGRARRAPAVGAVAIRCVEEFVCHEIMYRTAIAFPFELATTRFLRIRHGSASLHG
jgi:hypothetical protein